MPTIQIDVSADVLRGAADTLQCAPDAAEKDQLAAVAAWVLEQLNRGARERFIAKLRDTAEATFEEQATEKFGPRSDRRHRRAFGGLRSSLGGG